MPETKKTSCLFCSLQCAFAMEMDAGVPVRIDLDQEAPQNLGSLCVRGHYNYELLVHPKRNLAAAVNRRRVTWMSGMTRVAGKLDEVRGQHGAEAVGIIVGTELSNEDYDAAAAFAKSLGTPNVAVAYDGTDLPLIMGGGAGNALPTDIDDADCFVLVGDVFWGHPCIARRVIESRYKSRSNRIYTINPYRSNTDWFADRHVEVAPGGEPVVLAGLLNALGDKGSPRTDVETAARVGGLHPDELKAIADGLSHHAKVVVMTSTRLGDSASAYLTGKLAAKLAEKLGGLYAPFFRGGNAIGAFNRIGSGRTVPEILEGVSEGTIKGLLVFGPDLIQMYPGAVTTDQLESLDLLAASAIFENDTTKHSDVALPQSVWTEMGGSYSGSVGVSTDLEPLTKPQGDAHSVREMLEGIAAETHLQLAVAPATGSNPPLALDEQEELDRLATVSKSDGAALVESISPLHRWDGNITGRMSFPKVVHPYCEVWVGEEAAGALGLDTGANVALATDRGETSIIATVTDRMPGELVAVPSYVPDVRGLLTWTVNPGTRWFDVTATGVRLTPESQ